MAQRMDGQWIGRVGGEAPGLGVFELDDSGTELKGIAYHFPDDPSAPGVAVRIDLKNRDRQQSLKGLTVIPINPSAGQWLPPDQVPTFFPEGIVSPNADLEIAFLDNGNLHVSYKTTITKGYGELIKSLAGNESVLPKSQIITTWDQFKERACAVEPHRYFYRGQSLPNRLRTSFHRTRRKALALYRDDDVQELRRALSPQLKHVFDLRDADQNGAFYNLLQHHGYPTPILDWTLSPFVAAYFAFSTGATERNDDEVVRIITFDAKSWQEDVPQSSLIAYARPHFSIIDLLAIENPRMIPQQAKATLTNLDDIETYVANVGVEKGKAYLMAVDLRLAERQRALSELDLMGINEGALFPGVDGTCKALRYKNFGA